VDRRHGPTRTALGARRLRPGTPRDRSGPDLAGTGTQPCRQASSTRSSPRRGADRHPKGWRVPTFTSSLPSCARPGERCWAICVQRRRRHRIEQVTACATAGRLLRVNSPSSLAYDLLRHENWKRAIAQSSYLREPNLDATCCQSAGVAW
jgi:hypothetical protein